MTRPTKDEYTEYWSRYIDLATEDDVVSALEKQGKDLSAILARLGEDRGGYRYAPDKWSVKDLVQHVSDAERIFTYRALSIARGETRSLLGFDQDVFAEHADTGWRTLADVAEEFAAVRRATIALFRGFSDDAWKRIGTANENRISARALAYVALGHSRHHERVLRERYVKS